MRGLKKSLKFTGRVLLGCVLCLLVYVLAAYVCSRITIEPKEGKKKEVAIYISTNGVHTDIIVPIRNDQMDWSKLVKFGYTSVSDTNYQYLSLGWGDKGFYLQTPAWADLKFSLAFKAAFGLSSTAIHATFYRQIKESDHCRKIDISKDQYLRLVSCILESFQKDKEGNVIHIDTKANYGISDAFYEANGRYSLFYTCNTWANNILKNCGQKSCLWTIFDTGIFDKYR